MSKKRKVRAKSVPKGRRFSIPVVLTIAVVAAAAIALVARQMVNASAQEPSAQKKPLTAQEAQRFGTEIKRMLNKDGVVVVNHADGSSSLQSPNGFQNVMMARVEDDGSVTKSCVDTPEAAADFIGIDRTLAGAAPKAPQANQPAKTTVQSTLR